MTLPPGMSAFCRCDRVAHGGDRDPVGGQPVGVDPDVDRALEPADDATSPTPGERSSCDLTILSAISVSSRSGRFAGERDRHDRRRVVVELGDDRRVGCRAGSCADRVQTRSRTSWAATSMSRSRSNVAITMRAAGAGDRAQLVDALDRVDRLLDLLGDLRSRPPRGRRRAASVRTRDGRQVDGREAVDAEAEVAARADHDQGQDEHRREHRPADADLGELLHASVLLHDDGLAAGEVAGLGSTTVAGLQARRISTRSPSAAAGDDALLHRLAVLDGDHLLDARRR